MGSRDCDVDGDGDSDGKMVPPGFVSRTRTWIMDPVMAPRRESERCHQVQSAHHDNWAGFDLGLFYGNRVGPTRPSTRILRLDDSISFLEDIFLIENRFKIFVRTRNFGPTSAV